jgi:hypothetical protein
VIYGYFYLPLVEYTVYSQMLSINPEIQDMEPVNVQDGIFRKYLKCKKSQHIS